MLAVNNPAVTETAIVPWSPNRFSWRVPVATMAVAEPARVVQGPEPAPIVQGPPRGPSIAHIVHGFFSDFIDREVHSTTMSNQLAVASNNRAIVVWHPPLLNHAGVRQVAPPSGTSVEPDIPPVPPALNDAEEVAPPVPPAIKPASRKKPKKFKTYTERHPVARLDDGFDDDGFGVFGDDDEDDEHFPAQWEEDDERKPEEEARPSKKMRKHPPTHKVNDPAEPEEEARPSKKMRKHPPTYKDPAELDSASECKLDSLSNSSAESDSDFDPAKDNQDDEEEEEDIAEEAIDEDSEAIDEDSDDDDSNRNGNGKVMAKRKGKIYKAAVRPAKGKVKAKRKAHRKPKRKAGTPPTIAEEQLDNLVREKVCAPSVL